MSFKMKWDDKKIVKAVGRVTESGMRKVGIFLEGDIKRSMKIGGLATGAHSAPGQVPFVQLGNLKNSIGHEVTVGTNKTIGIVGVKRGIATAKSDENPEGYGRTLELGSSKIRPRPYLVPALKRNWKQIGRMLVGVR